MNLRAGTVVSAVPNANGHYELQGGTALANTYTLSLAANPVAAGENGLRSYDEGTLVRIKAEPKTGYTFSGWAATAGIVEDTNATETTFVMPSSDVTVTANYKLNEHRPAAPKYLYYRNVDGDLVVVDYALAVNELLNDNPVLINAVRKALREAIGAFRDVFVEDTHTNTINYSQAIQDQKTYLEAQKNLVTYGAEQQAANKRLIINPVSGEAEEVDF